MLCPPLMVADRENAAGQEQPGQAEQVGVKAVHHSPHWLPIPCQIQFMVLVPIFKAISELGPNYTLGHLTLSISPRTLITQEQCSCWYPEQSSMELRTSYYWGRELSYRTVLSLGPRTDACRPVPYFKALADHLSQVTKDHVTAQRQRFL